VKLAVTGATGFVGGHVARALRRSGHELTCLVRQRARASALEAEGCRLVRGSLEDEAALRDLVADAEAVVHVAGVVEAAGQAVLMRANRDATARLARAARAAGVARLVYVSSLSVTGPTVPGRPLDESGPPRPVTPYGRSKLAGEEAVREAGVPFTILRPPAVYGPGDRQFLRVFRLARFGVVPILGDGRQELSLVHAADLAGAVAAVLESPAAVGRVYHAAHSEIVTQRGLVAAIAAAAGRARPAVLPLPAGLVRVLLHVTGAAAGLAGRATVLGPDKAPELLAPAWTCSSQALARDTGWRATTPLVAGLAETARSYRQAGWL
jgi:nucleoside-diphosphate-sugar epimerase